MAVNSIRLQAKIQDSITEVKVLIKHPMETGARKDLDTGKLIPAHFIEEVKCEYNNQIVMSAIWSGGISKNPYFAFKFKGGKSGEKLQVSWKDNQGDSDSAQAEIKE